MGRKKRTAEERAMVDEVTRRARAKFGMDGKGRQRPRKGSGGQGPAARGPWQQAVGGSKTLVCRGCGRSCKMGNAALLLLKSRQETPVCRGCGGGMSEV